jgi:arylsulfatase A-like enzyme/lipopolysaccharide biosynthesis regulator YciM
MPAFPGAPVILISIDTLRSDHLPAYGYRGVDTPHIDGFRQDAVLFERAYSNSPLTLPSHLTVLTGLLPADHGVRNNLGFHFDATRQPTIPSLLRSEGYTAGAAVSAYVLRAATGIGAAFDDYDDAISLRGLAPTGSMQRNGAVTVEIAESWIRERGDSSFFYFLHLFEPHSPYDPPEPYRSRYPLAYDGEIAAVDSFVGEFIESLKDIGVYNRALIVLLSDHGEGLSDHGEEEHGIFLYREAIQVPLILKLPNGHLAGSTVERPAQLVDILPTITELVAVETPAVLPGRSLFGDVPGESKTSGIVAETMYPRIHLGWSELWSLIDGRYHFISAPTPELYDLQSDPGERHDLISARPDEGKRLAAILDPLKRELGETPQVDSEDAERLRALGYLGTAAVAAADGPLPDPKDRIESLRLLGQARVLADAGRIDEALDSLREMLAANPGFTDGWLQLARIGQQSGRFEDAIEAYQTVVDIAPVMAADVAASLATVHLRLNRISEAEGWARRSIAGGSVAGHLLLGRIHFSRREMLAAEEEARLAMTDSLYRVSAAVLLAESLVAQNRLDEALEVIIAALDDVESRRLEPVERLQMTHGDILGRLERYDEAEGAFLAEIAAFPSNQMAYTNLAVVYYVRSNTDLARATLERMVQNNPHIVSLLLAERTCRQVGDAEAAAVWQQRIEANQ